MTAPLRFLISTRFRYVSAPLSYSAFGYSSIFASSCSFFHYGSFALQNGRAIRPVFGQDVEGISRSSRLECTNNTRCEPLTFAECSDSQYPIPNIRANFLYFAPKTVEHSRYLLPPWHLHIGMSNPLIIFVPSLFMPLLPF